MSASPGNAASKDHLKSPNFQFLAGHHTLLVHLAALAERYLFDDPSTALFKLRQFAELLARQACANVGIATSPADDQVAVLNLLRDRRAAAADTLDLFHALRKTGNAAVHEGKGTQSDALHHLRMARQLAIWFDRSFGNSKQSYGPFVPPPNPATAMTEYVGSISDERVAYPPLPPPARPPRESSASTRPGGVTIPGHGDAPPIAEVFSQAAPIANCGTAIPCKLAQASAPTSPAGNCPL